MDTPGMVAESFTGSADLAGIESGITSLDTHVSKDYLDSKLNHDQVSRVVPCLCSERSLSLFLQVDVVGMEPRLTSQHLSQSPPPKTPGLF
ncbi:UNVERIFIED_CONTAM: hypothetical protein FKN15_013880 [Acipenser sinensis]